MRYVALVLNLMPANFDMNRQIEICTLNSCIEMFFFLNVFITFCETDFSSVFS